LVLDDGLNLPRVGRVRAALAVVVAGLGQVPEVVDDTGADEGAALGVEGDAPGVAGAFAEDLEVLRPRVDAEHRAGELVFLAAVLDAAVVEDAVETVQPAVGPPGE